MKLEVLFPELGSLYGDSANIKYLSKCIKEVEIIETHNTETPAFITGGVDMVYMGSMTEPNQLFALSNLRQHTDAIKKAIDNGTVFLFTGNAMELLGARISDSGGENIECLGLFDFWTKRNTKNRLNYLFLGEYEGEFGKIEIVGNKSQFSEIMDLTEHAFIKAVGGMGNCQSAEYEGIHYKNLFATYLIGPFLLLNPLFTEHLLQLLGCDGSLAFRHEIESAYDLRLRQLKNPAINFELSEH